MRRCLSRVNVARQFISAFPAFSGCQVRNVSAHGRDCRAPTFHPVAVRPEAVRKPQSHLLCGCDVPRGGTLLCFGVLQPWYTIGHTPPGIHGTKLYRRIRQSCFVPSSRGQLFSSAAQGQPGVNEKEKTAEAVFFALRISGESRGEAAIQRSRKFHKCCPPAHVCQGAARPSVTFCSISFLAGLLVYVGSGPIMSHEI